MKKLILSSMALLLGIVMFAQDNASGKREDGNEFVGKKIAVFAAGHQYDYDANKRVMRPSGGQGEAIAQSNAELMTSMLSWYGGIVLNPYDQECRALQSVINSMNGDVSALQAKAKDLGVDYVFFEDMEWMMFLDQLFIYEYQIKMLDVAANVIDRKSAYFYINALKDASNMDGATSRMTNGHADALKEMATRITPRLWGIVGLSKNGKKADMYSATFSGYYQNDVFHIYKAGGEQHDLNGESSIFITLTPLARSTNIEIEDSKYIISLDSKIELDPALIASAGSLITANIPGLDYPSIPITVVSLEGANASSYDNHNKEVTNYALYNAIHKNKMLKVVADPSNPVIAPKYECKLSNYSEAKNVVKVKLSITDLTTGSIVKEAAIESHTSNLDAVIASYVNEVFGTPVALGNVEKKTISYFVPCPIAYEEGEKFLLSLNDENHTPVVVYELVSWKGQEYVFEESKVLDKKAAGKIGKDPDAQYILTRYAEPLKDPKKDNSEFKKVASANKVFDILGK